MFSTKKDVMFSRRDLIKHLKETSQNARIAKISFVSPELFSVQVKCKVEADQNADYYHAFTLKWINEFSNFSATGWNVRSTFPKPVRMLFRKTYTCHRSLFNKKKLQGVDTRNQGCRATIDFKVKFINRNTVKNDIYLKHDLNMTIKIDFQHTHKLWTGQDFKYLKSTSETNERFKKYFSTGYSPCAAKIYNELLITECYGDNFEFTNNATINPSMRHVLYLHNKTKQEVWDSPCFEELMDPRKTDLEAAGGFMSYDNPEVVIIITPLMKRAISAIKTDHILIEGAAIAGSVVTFLYVPSKAGALPIACILHSEQSEAVYCQAFLAVKVALEKVSNQNIDPKLLIIKESDAMREAVDAIFPNSKVVTSRWSLCSAIWKSTFGIDIKLESRARHNLMKLFYDMISSHNIADGVIYYDQIKSKVNIPSLLIYVDQLWQRRNQWMYKQNLCTNLVETSIRVMNEFIQSRCKYFNMYAMADAVCHVMEKQYRHVLLARVNSRNVVAAYTRLSVLKVDETVKMLSPNTYSIKKNLKKPRTIIFRTDTWCCDCNVGKNGWFCGHLTASVNVLEAESTKTEELTDEEKFLFTEIAGGEPEPDRNAMKSETEEDDLVDIEAVDMESTNDSSVNEDIDQEDMATYDTVDDQFQTSAKSGTESHYFYLDVKTENLDGNDPLEETLNLPKEDESSATFSAPMAVEFKQNQQDGKSHSHMDDAVDLPSTSKDDLKSNYESAMALLNNEFRRLNKYFKESPNASNMMTMKRLTRELGKIRPVERVNLTGMHIQLNNDIP